MIRQVADRRKYQTFVEDIQRAEEQLATAHKLLRTWLSDTLGECGLAEGDYLRYKRDGGWHVMKIKAIQVYRDQDKLEFRIGISGRKVLGITDDRLVRLAGTVHLNEDHEFEPTTVDKLPKFWPVRGTQRGEK